MAKISVQAIPQGGGMALASGSYIGTGYDGGSYPNTITCPFEPSWVFIACIDARNTQAFWARGTGYGLSIPDNYNSQCNLTWSGRTLSWYAINGASYQFNEQGKRYRWFAFGPIKNI